MKIKQENLLYLRPLRGNEFCVDGVVTGVDVTVTVLVAKRGDAGTDSDMTDDP